MTTEKQAGGGEGEGRGFNRKAEAKTEREGKKSTAEEVSSPLANDNKWNQNKSRGVEKKKKRRKKKSGL